jgi:hypothetical protein
MTTATEFKPGDRVKTPVGEGRIIACNRRGHDPVEYFIRSVDRFKRTMTEWWRADQLEAI